MQVVILAADRGIRLNRLTKNNTKCMVEINGVTLIERMLKQLDGRDFNRIIIVDGYQKDNLEKHVNNLDIATPIIYVHNKNFAETNNVFSLYLTQDYLREDDFVVIDSDIIFEDAILDELLDCQNENAAVIDKYKSWMTGQGIELDEKGQIIRFKNENEINHNQMKECYKTIGMYKFSSNFFKNSFLPFLEAYIKVYGSDSTYEQVLSILKFDSRSSVAACMTGSYIWYEINDIQDIDLAATLFSSDEDAITDAMLNRWGGYWRYPNYLDYFYLVTPYYPTSALLEEIKANFEDLIEQYPSGMKVNALLAAKEFMVEPENIIIGNGAAELIKSVMSKVTGKTGFIRPTFDEYPNRLCKEEHVDYFVNSKDFTYSSSDIIGYFDDKEIKNLVLVNPENPSGNYIAKSGMIEILEWAKKKDIKVIVDESFVDFVDEISPSLIQQEILDKYPNLYVVKSISKSYGVPGLRLGVLASGDKVTIAWMKKDVSIWNINSFAEFYMQIAGKYRNDYEHALEMFRKERILFERELRGIKELRVIPSQANYIMVELLDGIDAEWLKRTMLIDEKIFIKTLNKKIKDGNQYLRLSIRNHEDNTKFIESLRRVLKERTN